MFIKFITEKKTDTSKTGLGLLLLHFTGLLEKSLYFSFLIFNFIIGNTTLPLTGFVVLVTGYLPKSLFIKLNGAVRRRQPIKF